MQDMVLTFTAFSRGVESKYTNRTGSDFSFRVSLLHIEEPERG